MMIFGNSDDNDDSSNTGQLSSSNEELLKSSLAEWMAVQNIPLVAVNVSFILDTLAAISFMSSI